MLKNAQSSSPPLRNVHGARLLRHDKSHLVLGTWVDQYRTFYIVRQGVLPTHYDVLRIRPQGETLQTKSLITLQQDTFVLGLLTANRYQYVRATEISVSTIPWHCKGMRQYTWTRDDPFLAFPRQHNPIGEVPTYRF